MLNTYQLISLLHILIIAPFLAYIAYMGLNNKPVPDIAYIVLLLLAAWAFFYHIYKLIKYSK